MERTLITRASEFIGHHFVTRLKEEGTGSAVSTSSCLNSSNSTLKSSSFLVCGSGARAYRPRSIIGNHIVYGGHEVS